MDEDVVYSQVLLNKLQKICISCKKLKASMQSVSCSELMLDQLVMDYMRSGKHVHLQGTILPQTATNFHYCVQDFRNTCHFFLFP